MALTREEQKIKDAYIKEFKSNFGYKPGESKDEIGYRKVIDSETGKERLQKTNFSALERGNQARGDNTSTSDIRRFDRNDNVGTSDISDQFQALEEQKRKQALSALDKARSGQLSALQAQEEQVSPLAIRQRAKVGQTTQRSAKDLSTYLASRGLASSGEVGRGADRISAEEIAGTSAVTQAEQDQLNAIRQARAGVETGYQADVANVEAGLAATALQNQINMSQQELARNQQLQDLADQRAYTEQIAGQDRTRQEQEFVRQQEIANIGQYANIEGGYQAEINRRANNNDPSDDYLIPQLQIARNQKIAGIEQGQASAQQTAYNQAFDRFNKLGYVANQQDAEILNLPVGSRTATYANQLRDDARIGSRGINETTNDTPEKQYEQFRATLLNASPSSALQDLQANRDTIIAVAGRQEYEQLLNTLNSKIQDLAGDRFR